MNRNLLHGLVAVAALLSSTACSSKPTSDDAKASSAEHKLAELTVDEVEARIVKNDGKTFVFDDNHDAVYASGHVPGAKHLDADDVPASAFPADKDATLIFYCADTH